MYFLSLRFILAMESYGGHYGPALVPFFDQQSALIQQGKLQGEPIDVGALMIDKLRRSFLSLAPAPVLIPQLAADGVTHSSRIRSTSTSPLTHRDMANSNQTLFLQTLTNYTHKATKDFLHLRAPTNNQYIFKILLTYPHIHLLFNTHSHRYHHNFRPG